MLARQLCIVLAGGLLILTCGCSGKNSTATNVKTYVNSSAGRTGNFKDHYVDFSFNYPTSWKEVPTKDNYVKVERSLAGDKPDDNYTQENISVGAFWMDDSAAAEGKMPSMADTISEQFSRGFPGYRKTSQGATTIGSYKGYEFRFSARIEETSKGPITMWGRVVLLLPPGGGNNGVLLSMIATNLAPGISGEGDVGAKGELPVILNSFKFGK